MRSVIRQFAEDVPTGSDPETVERFYEWLYAHYIERQAQHPDGSPNALREAPEWELQVFGPLLQVYVVGIGMILFFGAFAYWFNYVRRDEGELYKPSDHTVVPERHGKPPLFGRLSYLAITLWAFYYAVEHILTGQVF